MVSCAREPADSLLSGDVTRVRRKIYIYVSVCKCMATKSITITEEAYERLRQSKREAESFSRVIKRLTSNAAGLLRFAGSISDEEADRLEERIKKNRERWMKEEAKRREQIRRELHGVS